MIHFRSKVGFSLIEVIIAVAVMAMVMAPIFVTESTIFKSVGRYSWHLERLLEAKNFLLEMRRALFDKEPEERALEKKIERPDTMLRDSMGAVHEGSALRPFRDMHSEKVVFEWYEYGKKRTDALVTFSYKPKSKQS